MKRLGILLLFALICFSITSCSKNPQSELPKKQVLTDDMGYKVSISGTPKRIVSLAPSITEMIYLLKLEDKLVGNTLYCDYPEAAKKITKVGDILSIDAEKILMLKPDIVFVSVEGNTKESYKKLIDLGIKVFVSNPRNFEGIKKTLTDLGNIFNKRTLSDSCINSWNKRMSVLTTNSVKHEAKKVMFIIELKPLIVAGVNTFLNEYVKVCGMKNIVEDTKINYPILNREEILKRNPSFILYATDKKDVKNVLLQMYPEWKNIDAVKNNNVFLIDANIYFRPGPRFIDACEEIFRNLHPEVLYQDQKK